MVWNDPMQNEIPQAVRQMVGRIPRWLCGDLASSDARLRERAEDALSAMIIAALAELGASAVSLPPPSAPSSMKGLNTRSAEI
jgi:hypothetical protein